MSLGQSETCLASSMMPRLFTIADITWETGEGDIFTWQLTPDDGEPLVYTPGQFNMLYTFGVGEVPISICSDHQGDALSHTIRAAGSVTRAMSTLRTGHKIGLRGPFGSAWPLEISEGKDLIIMAGGIGLAPLRPVVYAVLRNRDRFNRVHLLYGTRTPLDIIYRNELEVWQAEKRIHVGVTVDRAPAAWHGQIGVVTGLLKQIQFAADNAVAMLCGPEVMINFAELALQQAGLTRESIYVSLERNMKCAIGHCGHCQLGPHFICKDGPVFRLDAVDPFFQVREF